MVSPSWRSSISDVWRLTANWSYGFPVLQLYGLFFFFSEKVYLHGRREQLEGFKLEQEQITPWKVQTHSALETT